MSATIAFDVYGTLIDTQGIVKELEDFVGENAPEFSRRWREKQLEYSFRRGLMRHYRNFNVCTSNALDYTASLFKLELGAQDKQHLLERYLVLPAFDDAKQGLLRVKDAGLGSYAFSNGTKEAVESLLSSAGIREHFIDIVSVDEIGSFKPDPDVYHHFLKRSGSTRSECWLISSNPFDVIGARSAGWHAAWVQRSPEMLFDPWDIQPTITVDNLADIAEQIDVFMQSS